MVIVLSSLEDDYDYSPVTLFDFHNLTSHQDREGGYAASVVYPASMITNQMNTLYSENCPHRLLWFICDATHYKKEEFWCQLNTGIV